MKIKSAKRRAIDIQGNDKMEYRNKILIFHKIVSLVQSRECHFGLFLFTILSGNKNKVLNLSATEIESSLSLPEIISAVRDSLLRNANGHYTIPERLHLAEGENTFLVMPALSHKYLCTKIVSVIPKNAKAGQPLISGTVQLTDAGSGECLALLDAPMITALRTGAVGALGLDTICQSELNSIGIIGCGLQGTWQTIFAATIRKLKRVYCYSRTPKTIARYKAKVQQYYPALKIVTCDSPEEVVERSEVVYGCTTSTHPIFANDASLIAGKRFISVGSFRKDMQEFPDEVYKTADELIIDAAAARHEVGDVLNAINKGWIKSDAVVLLQDILKKEADYFRGKNLVFKSVGMAAFDLGLASAIYEKKAKNE